MNKGKVQYPIVLTLLIALASVANAKVAEFGFKGGLQNSYIYPRQPYGWGNGSGGGLGVYINFKLMKDLFLQSELHYIRSTTEATFKSQVDTLRRKIRLDYLELPVLIMVSLFPQKFIRPKMIFGAYLGYNLNAQETMTFENQNNRESIRDQFRPFYLGWLASLGCEVRLKKKTWLITELRYTDAMGPISRKSFVDSRRLSRLCFLIGLGW